MGWRQEREGVFMTWHHPGTKDVILDLGDDSDEVLRGIPLGSALLPVYRRLIAGGGLLLHAALVEYRGCGCLLAASGGRGKSTCARRLPPPWRMASDDAALLVPTGNGYRVHPFPTWSELLHTSSPISWKVEEHFPVSAVFFLEQSPCRDQAVPLGQAQGTVSLYHSAAEAYGIPAVRSKPRWQHRELSAGIFRNAGHIARTVPCLLLKVRRDGTFWEEMERVLRGDAGFPGDRKRYD
jgi:SynChlorMet cassette protein ScmC